MSCPFREKLRAHWPAAFAVLLPIANQPVRQAQALNQLLGLGPLDGAEFIQDGLQRLQRTLDARIAAGDLPTVIERLPEHLPVRAQPGRP